MPTPSQPQSPAGSPLPPQVDRLFYEHRSEPLLPRRKFLCRMALHGLFAAGVLVVSLGIGILGYHYLEGMQWLDAMLNASMILGGMGPIGTLHTEIGKVFASFYALFSGIIFLVIAGILVAPVAHRLMHRLHLDDGEERSD